nr:WAT1-related protein At2g39510-like [Ipomoea batatas]
MAGKGMQALEWKKDGFSSNSQLGFQWSLQEANFCPGGLFACVGQMGGNMSVGDFTLLLEKVEVRKLHSQAKILGTVVTLGGAMIMTLVRGPNIGLPWTKHTQHLQTATALHSQQDLVEGAAMIMAGCSCWAIFYILQAITLKSYPAGLSLTTLICTVGSLQASVVTLVAERKNPAEKRPVFVTSFSPLSMIVVAIMGSFILGEQVDFGKVLGAGVIVVGLYMVIWGKKQDEVPGRESTDDQVALPSSTLVKSSNTLKGVAGDEAV